MLSSCNQKMRFSGLDFCWIFHVLAFSSFGGWGKSTSDRVQFYQWDGLQVK